MVSVHNGEINGVPVSFIRTEMGSPNAAVTMETLKRTGAKIIIRADVCGSLSSTIPIGSIFLAKDALIGEGTSSYYCRKYGETRDKSTLDPRFLPILQKILPLATKDWKNWYKEGCIWTIDALLCETENEIAAWRELGAQAVDMETSVMYFLSELFKIPTIALMGVTDIPGSEFDLFTENKMHPQTELAMQRVVEATEELLPLLAKELPSLH